MSLDSNHDVTILYRADKSNTASVNLYPLVIHSSPDFLTTADLGWVLRRDSNRCLLMVGWLRDRPAAPGDEERKILDALRKKYDVLAYYDESDGTEIQQSAYLSWFDLWYKKQLLRDRKQYLRSFRGNRYFTEYYIDKYGAKDDPEPKPFTALKETELAKLRLGWNILLAAYPIQPMVKRAAAILAQSFGLRAARALVRRSSWKRRPTPNVPLCHARFNWGTYRPTVDYQRRVFFEKVQGLPGFLSGRVPPPQYARELREVQGVLSPFGWGEVCYRDSEAVRSGAVLFKPDMRHVETWPNIYQAETTYVPLAWDGSDVEARVSEVLGDSERTAALAQTAWNVLAEAEAALPRRVADIAQEIRNFGKTP